VAERSTGEQPAAGPGAPILNIYSYALRACK